MIGELEALALKSVALKDPEYFTRKVYRYYSEKFHTPLDQVYNLPWAFVFTNYIEHIIENNNSKEDIYKLSLELFYPEKKKVKTSLGEFDSEEEEIQAWIKQIEEEEKAKRDKKKKQEDEAKMNLQEQQEIKIDSEQFEHLEKEMEEENTDE